MAYCRSGWVFFVLLLHASLLLLPSPVLSRDLEQEDQKLLDGLNDYRRAHNLPDLSEVRGASCLADRIATRYQDSQQCFALPSGGSSYSDSISAGSGNSIPGYYRLLGDCGLDIDTTKDGVILPACVGDISTDDLTNVVSNFTQTGYAQYLRDSDYTRVGIGSEGVWAVVVLTTDDQEGDFSGGRSMGDLMLAFWLIVVHYWVVCFMIM